MKHRGEPHPFRVALEARDIEAAAKALAPDVVLYPPVSARPFRGREEVQSVLRTLLEKELSFLECRGEIRSGDTVALHFRVGIGGRELEVLDLLRLDDEDRVREYRVFARPIADAAAYMAAIGPRLARRRGRIRAGVVRALSRPLPRLLELGDRAGSWLAR